MPPFADRSPLLAALDHLNQNDVLLKITDQSIATASALGRKDIHTFLVTQRAAFLFRELSDLLYQQQNLKLAAKVFRWIDFSLQKDKSEYAAIDEKRTRLEKEIAALEAGVLAAVQSNPDHYFRGKILMALAEISFSRFMYDRGVLMNGGHWKSKIMNLYVVRRWNLDKLIGYDRRARRKHRDSFRNVVALDKRAMKEFSAGDYQSDAVHVAYALALKHTVTFRFSKASTYLNLAKSMANPQDDRNLFIHIGELEKDD